MAHAQADLIYDIGLHRGDDAAYYLSRGCRVVGIEANRALAEGCRQRFRAEVAGGRLCILNIGIGPSAGEFDFWVHKVHDEWSSFTRNPGWRAEECERIRIRCVPFGEILEAHGTPHYLKVDIEGADALAIRALNPNRLPTYVSFEAGPDAVGNLCHLHHLGYDAFKIVDQTTHNDPQVALQHNNEDRWRSTRRRLAMWKWRVTRQFHLDETVLAGAWRSMRGRAEIMQTIETSAVERRLGAWLFPEGSSGPFGEDTPGEWRPLEPVLYNWLHRHFRRFDRGTLTAESWYDFHARLGDAAKGPG